jgi:hypothetical protein
MLSNVLAKGLPEGSKTFPLLPNTKRPAGGRGHLDATASYLPESNYGISLDDQFLVVDIDDPTRVSEAFAAKLTHTPTWCQRTRRGEHYLFKVPKGFKGTNAKIPGNAGDLKVNGYIVGPGSEVEGHTYTVRDTTEPAPAPLWLLGLVGEGKERNSIKQPPNEVESSLSLKEGEGRNLFLVRVAGLLRGQGLGVDQVKEAVRGINAQVCEPPLSEHEIRGTIDKSIAKWDQGVVELGGDLILPANMLQASAVTRIGEPLAYMIRPLIPQVGLTLMHGKGAVGKSTFASFVSAYATRKELRVLLLCTEEDPLLHIRRAEHMGADPDYIYWPDPRKISVCQIKFPTNVKDVEKIIEELGIGFLYIDGIKTHADPSLSKGMHEGDKSRMLVEGVAALAIKYKIAILGTFHNKKDSDVAMGSEELANTARQQLSLTSAGEAEAKRLSVTVDKSNGPDDGKVVQFSWHAKEYFDKETGEYQKEIVEDRIDADDYREGYSEIKNQMVPYIQVVKLSEQKKAEGQGQPARDKTTQAILDLLGSGRSQYSTVLRPQVIEMTGASENTVKRSLAELLEQGIIASDGKVQYTSYRLIPTTPV